MVIFTMIESIKQSPENMQKRFVYQHLKPFCSSHTCCMRKTKNNQKKLVVGFNPSEKNIRRIGNLPQNRSENKQIFQTTRYRVYWGYDPFTNHY